MRQSLSLGSGPVGNTTGLRGRGKSGNVRDAGEPRPRRKTVEVERPRATDPVRLGGPDLRENRPATAELFISDFKIRGGEFGENLSFKNRQAAMDRACDALASTPPSAHYERERRVINLTGSCGAGALCHEWWHAFDHHLATLAGFPDAFASGVESFDTGVAALRQALARLLYDFDAEGKHLPSCFLAKALSLDEGKRKAYFSLAEELSARAFEAGVAAFLKLGGRRNDFLVFGADRLPLYPEQTGALAFFGEVAPIIRKTLAPARQDTAAGR